MIGAVAAPLPVGLEVVPPVGAVRAFYRKTRFAGGMAFCLLSLAACVLVARYLSDASWPLQGARVPLVFAAAAAYFASFGFRASGWRQLFPRCERPDGARCLAACGAAAASGVVLPFRLDYVVKITLLRRLGGVTLGLETIAISIVALGMVDAVAMLPLAVSALVTSGPVLRAPLLVVVLFCLGCLGILALGQRVDRLPVVGRSDRVHRIYRRVAESTRLSRRTVLAGLLLLGCWTSRALGSTVLLSALGVPFSPTLALVVLCMSAATSILPITAGGAVAGMGATAGVLFALGVSKGVALNFSLASGLLLTGTALAAAGLGLAGSLILTLRARAARRRDPSYSGPTRGRIPIARFAPSLSVQVREVFPSMATGTVKWFNDASDYGFIVPDEAGVDLYLRGGNFEADGGTSPTMGDRVEFQTRVAGMGPEAIDVVPARLREAVAS